MGRRRNVVFGCLAVVVASSVIASSATAIQAHSTTRAHAVPHTTAPDLFVTVRVTMTDKKFVVSNHSGPRGADAKFVIHNTSNKPHNFSLGREDYGEGTQTGFTITVKPGQRIIKVLYLDIRSKLKYFPGLAADRDKKGMEGVFSIGPCTSYEQNTGVGDC
jgi:hypothetical protein